MHNQELGSMLLYVARAAIASELGLPVGSSPDVHTQAESRLQSSGATFVTLTLHGKLRGCIGTLQAHRNLIDDCAANATAAAFADDRFSPLRAEEFDEVRIEVSIVGESLPFAFNDEADACRQLRPGKDGVILEYHWHKATFLPQVWDELPEPCAFLAALKRKAGLAPDFWSPEIRMEVYEVEHYSETEP